MKLIHRACASTCFPVCQALLLQQAPVRRPPCTAHRRRDAAPLTMHRSSYTRGVTRGSQHISQAAVWTSAPYNIRFFTKTAGVRSPMSAALSERYSAMVASGELLPDGQQSVVVDMLCGVLDELSAASGSERTRNARGIYIHGSVGSGKSLLMNMFFATARESLPHLKAKRVHFHDFMVSAHAAIHAHKQQRSSAGAVTAVGQEMARANKLLCFDEFQISDIADAAILSQLFKGMWVEGCCVIATSNRSPSELYKDGLNRHVYLPKFEAMLQRHCAVHNINLATRSSTLPSASPSSPRATSSSSRDRQHTVQEASCDRQQTVQKESRGGGVDEVGKGGDGKGRVDDEHVARDYRLLGREKKGVYLHPNGPDSNKELDKIFESVCSGHVTSETIHVPPGRTMLVERCGKNAAMFEYNDLFVRAIGPSDFGAVAKRFDIVVIRNVTAFDLRTHNEARRFMNFVDILYDSGCGLVLSAGGQFLDSQDHGRLADNKSEVILKVRKEGGSSSSSATTYIGDTEWSSTGRIGVSLFALSAVRDVSFAKDRAISRLFEMRSEEYLLSRPRCAALVAALG